ncbi:hypothetical protein MUY14_36945 [Amycolatopsis sp. FBCC-B4732]|uniref:hypothetical protein n=1 Tax=Amycolatopsis sp. FBCC-B4732 TaxID=3079339 RepID=UPI001FF4EC87|nr:hypothetical protein [Amycolatopsis sp. FBCC-B4732]UOX87267.1 hypothetical protein MUY14_36945 [Amycolatopsis sp. FBCC-B4732]
MNISDWKRAIYALLALPAWLGGPRARRRLARRWLGAEPRPGGLLAAAASFPVALLVWYLVGRIATFGFFWTEDGAAGSWGGPSLLGAWIVHFFCALGMAVVCLGLLRPLTRWQVRSPDLVDSSHGG